MKLLLIAVALYCFTSCGVKEKKDASLKVVNNSNESVSIRVAGNFDIEDISRELIIPPHSSEDHNWEYFVHKKVGGNLAGDYDVEIVARRPNRAVLMWKKFSNMSVEDLKLNIICDDRNCDTK